MKRIFVLVFASLLLSSPALAQTSGSSYDWRTGSTYQWNRDSNGSTNINGFNGHTGSIWNQTIERNGNQHGTDSRGNYWQYDNSSGTYWNSNGRFCTGHGAYRVCN